MIFKLLSNPIVLYTLIFSLIIFFLLFIWRKLNGLESYVFVLEKRLNNFKKSSTSTKDKEPSLNKSKDTIINTDIIMNEVFDSICSPSVDCCIKKFPKYESNTSFISLPVVNHTEDIKETSVLPADLPTEVINELSTDKQIHLPSENTIEVAKDNVKLDLSDALPIQLSSDLSIELKKDNVEDDLKSDTKSDIIKTISTSGKKLLKLDLSTLKKYCDELNISSDGNKNQIIERLLLKTQ